MDGDVIMNKKIKVILHIVAFIVFMSLIIIGQKTVGVGYLGMMLIGLIGLMVQLYLYNRKYQ